MESPRITLLLRKDEWRIKNRQKRSSLCFTDFVIQGNLKNQAKSNKKTKKKQPKLEFNTIFT